MGWLNGDAVVLVTGALFAAVVWVARLVGDPLSRASRRGFLFASLAFVAVAAVLRTVDRVTYPGPVWLFPVVPVVIVAVIVRSAHDAREHAALSPSRVEARDRSGEPELALTAVEVDLRDVAASPATSAGELARLAYRHQVLRPIIVANPSTPLALREWLSAMDDDAPRRSRPLARVN